MSKLRVNSLDVWGAKTVSVIEDHKHGCIEIRVGDGDDDTAFEFTVWGDTDDLGKTRMTPQLLFGDDDSDVAIAWNEIREAVKHKRQEQT